MNFIAKIRFAYVISHRVSLNINWTEPCGVPIPREIVQVLDIVIQIYIYIGKILNVYILCIKRNYFWIKDSYK